MPYTGKLHPVRPHRQQQSGWHPHRVIRQQTGPQLRRRLPDLFQQVRRRPQTLRRQQTAQLPGKAGFQSAGCRHQHRLTARRVPQGVAAVPESSQLRNAPPHADPHRDQLAANAVPRRRPKYHRQNQIGRTGRNQQDLDVHIRIKNAVHCRNRASRQQPYGQHTARQGAGYGKQQQEQTKKLFFSAKDQQRQQRAHRQLDQRSGQEASARQKNRHGIGPARQRRKQTAPPPDRYACQPGREQKEQVIHGRVQQKYAVHINHCHAVRPPFVNAVHYRAGPPEKPSQKGSPA